MSKHLQSGQHPDADQISAFVDHALPSHEREKILAHLAECTDCRETVALSLPVIEDAPTTTAVKNPKSWSWGVRLLWPAGALSLAVLLLYINYSTKSQRGSGQGPDVALEQPTTPAKGGSTPAIAGGGGGGSSSLASRENEISGNAPQARPSATLKEKPENSRQSTAGGLFGADTTRRVAELHLPGGAMAISMVTRGRQVLAIDDRNTVFLSNDGGVSWVAVQVPWKGRAVKTELVSSDVAQFRAQKSLRQELKGAYLATPANGSGAGQTAPPTSALTAPAPSASAASQGTLSGIITDRSGAVIPGASVAITDPANHASMNAVTGGDGQYRIDGLAPGTYQLEAEARGFNTTRLSAVQIAGSSSNTTNVTLDVGSSSETVMVQSAAPEIETTSSELGNNLISQKQESALRRPTPVFEITTDTGDRWTSADGVNWHHE